MACVVYSRPHFTVVILGSPNGPDFPRVRVNQKDEEPFKCGEVKDSKYNKGKWKVWSEELILEILLPLLREMTEKAMMFNGAYNGENTSVMHYAMAAVDCWEKRSMEKREKPRYLLKCFSLEAAKATLKSGRIRFSHPDFYNDPLEGRCVWKGPFSDNGALQKYDAEKREGLKNVRICCFSEKSLEGILPHQVYYADEEKGVTIFFNTDSLLKKYAPGEPEQDAISKRRMWYVYRVPREGQLKDNPVGVYNTKFCSWRHECEWRIILDAEKDVERLGLDVLQDENGRPVMDVAFNREEINCIILGAKMKFADAKDILEKILDLFGEINVFVMGEFEYGSYTRSKPHPISTLEDLEKCYRQRGLSTDSSHEITLTIDDSTFDAWNKMAMAKEKLLHQWCVDIINGTLNDNGESGNKCLQLSINISSTVRL